MTTKTATAKADKADKISNTAGSVPIKTTKVATEKKPDTKVEAKVEAKTEAAPVAVKPGKKAFEICIQKKILVEADDAEDVQNAAAPLEKTFQGFQLLVSEAPEGTKADFYVTDAGMLDKYATVVATVEALRSLDPAVALATVKGSPVRFVYTPQAPPVSNPAFIIKSAKGGAWIDENYMKRLVSEAQAAMRQPR
jgi:hypothetical protein